MTFEAGGGQEGIERTLLVLDLLLDILDGVGRLDLEGDGLARQGLNEDLHGRCACLSGHRTNGPGDADGRGRKERKDG